jgi:xylan 1,4-beta-xylosidase
MKKLIAAPLMGLAALLIGCDSANTTSDTSNSTAAAVSSPAAEKTARFTQFIYQGESQEKVTLGEGEFRNPILSGYAPDPTVARVGDDYYVVPSTFTHFPGLPIYHSKDLVNWTHIANAIDRPDQLNFMNIGVSRGIFAPDLSYHDGTYYIATTCVDCGGNFVITAKDIKGPWSEPHWLGFEGIDPSIHWDDSGKAYIVNNGAPNEEPRYDGHRAIWIQEFDYKNLKMVGERKQLINGGVDISTKPVWIEGPHIIQRNGFYYITAAEGGTSIHHSQTIFRADNVLGPYVPAEHNPILTQRDLDVDRKDPIIAAGHAKFVQLPNGDWWATFLAIRPYDRDMFNIGRETFLLPVYWENDWPYMLPPGERIPFTHKKPALPEQPAPEIPTAGDFGYTDNFDGNALGLSWMGIRNPIKPFYEVKDQGLNLACHGGLGDLAKVPSYVGRRQQHHIAEFTTTVNFNPAAEGDAAGLAAVQDDRHTMFVALTRLDGKDQVALFRRQGTTEDTLIKATPINKAKDVTLTLAFNAGKAKAYYEIDGQRQLLVDNVDATNLSTNVSGGFVGTIVGPYCTSN